MTNLSIKTTVVALIAATVLGGYLQATQDYEQATQDYETSNTSSGRFQLMAGRCPPSSLL